MGKCRPQAQKWKLSFLCQNMYQGKAQQEWDIICPSGSRLPWKRQICNLALLVTFFKNICQVCLWFSKDIYNQINSCLHRIPIRSISIQQKSKVFHNVLLVQMVTCAKHYVCTILLVMKNTLYLCACHINDSDFSAMIFTDKQYHTNAQFFTKSCFGHSQPGCVGEP